MGLIGQAEGLEQAGGSNRTDAFTNPFLFRYIAIIFYNIYIIYYDESYHSFANRVVFARLTAAPAPSGSCLWRGCESSCMWLSP